MAVRLSEVQFKELRSLVSQLQALTVEESEAGQIVDSAARLLEDVEVDRTYEEMASETVTRAKGGAYIIS